MRTTGAAPAALALGTAPAAPHALLLPGTLFAEALPRSPPPPHQRVRSLSPIPSRQPVWTTHNVSPCYSRSSSPLRAVTHAYKPNGSSPLMPGRPLESGLSCVSASAPDAASAFASIKCRTGLPPALQMPHMAGVGTLVTSTGTRADGCPLPLPPSTLRAFGAIAQPLPLPSSQSTCRPPSCQPSLKAEWAHLTQEVDVILQESKELDLHMSLCHLCGASVDGNPLGENRMPANSRLTRGIEVVWNRSSVYIGECVQLARELRQHEAGAEQMQKMLRHLREEYPAQVEEHVRSMHADYQHQIAMLEAEIGVRRTSLGEISEKRSKVLLSQPWQASPAESATHSASFEDPCSVMARQAMQNENPPVIHSASQSEKPCISLSSSPDLGVHASVPSFVQLAPVRHAREDGQSPFQAARTLSAEAKACAAPPHDVGKDQAPASPQHPRQQHHTSKERTPHPMPSGPSELAMGSHASRASRAGRSCSSVSHRVAEQSPMRAMQVAAADAKPSHLNKARRPLSSTRRPSASPQRGRCAGRTWSPQPASCARSGTCGGSQSASAASAELPRRQPKSNFHSTLECDADSTAVEPPAELFTRVRTALARVVGKTAAAVPVEGPENEHLMGPEVLGQRASLKSEDVQWESQSMLASDSSTRVPPMALHSFAESVQPALAQPEAHRPSDGPQAHSSAPTPAGEELTTERQPSADLAERASETPPESGAGADRGSPEPEGSPEARFLPEAASPEAASGGTAPQRALSEAASGGPPPRRDPTGTAPAAGGPVPLPSAPRPSRRDPTGATRQARAPSPPRDRRSATSAGSRRHQDGAALSPAAVSAEDIRRFLKSGTKLPLTAARGKFR